MKCIKELLLKVVPMEGEDGDLLPSLHTQQDIEKFAELIVRECAELMENQHTWITSVAASTLIRNHFKNEKF